MKKFDVIVIGSGPAGVSIAQKSAAHGKNTAVIDHEFGGTCALKGCTPKKVLAVTSEILRYACHLDGKGIEQVNVNLDWNSLIHFKRSFTELVPMQTKEGFAKRSIEVIEGTARFVNKNTLQIGNKKYMADKIAIATGARPMDLPIEGMENLITSDDLLELDTVPKRIIFVGGGYVAYEFAQIMRKAGCDVTILEATDQPIRGFDPFLVTKLTESFQREKIDVRTNFEVEKVEKKDKKYIVSGNYNKEPIIMECDLAVHGAGRQPNIDKLELDEGGVGYAKEGIRVNSFLQSISNENVYCAGDVADTGFPFTLVADYEGRVVANNMFREKKKRVDYKGVPFVLFTSPKLASVGKTENELIQNHIDFNKNEGDNSHALISRSLQEHFSAYKVFIDRKGKILGAHLIGPKADEVINGFAMAIQHNLTVKDLKRTFMSYPSAFSEIRKMI